MNNDARIQNILSALDHTYPSAHIVLSYGSPWELLVAVILSAQCTDVTVNKVTKTLFKIYPTLESYTKANLSEFEQHIKSTGFYHNKAKNILAAAKLIQSKFHGHVPKTMDEMLTIPGVARKTANVVLGNAYDIVEGIAVDTHVIRLSQRLRLVPIDKIGGTHPLFFQSTDHLCSRAHHVLPSCAHHADYIKDADPKKIETYLMKILPKSKWFSLTYQLIDHGRAICDAKKPKCDLCPLAPYCPVKR